MSVSHYGGCERLGELSIPSSDSSEKDHSTTASPQDERGQFDVDSPRSSSSTQDGSGRNGLNSGNLNLNTMEKPEEVFFDCDSGGALNEVLKVSEDVIMNGKLTEPLQVLWRRLRRLGCIIDVVQARPSRRKIRCWVESCLYKGGLIERVGLRCTLPSSVETAAQWICICTADVKRQNRLLTKFLSFIKQGEPTTSPHSSPIQLVPREKLLLFPFRICSRHFSSKWTDPSTPVMPTYHLPEKGFISREDLVPQLRRRYVFLSESGYEDIEIDKLEPNGVLMSPSDEPICCNVPGCHHKSSDISIFSRLHMKLFSIPTNCVDYGRWCVATRDGLGLPTAFDFSLPEDGHICEMHFLEGKRYSGGVMQDPSVFRKLPLEAINSSLSSLGALCFTTCAVNSCASAKVETICVPFPKAGNPLHSRWLISLLEADESFKYEDGLAICLRHFSLSHHDGCVPCLFLGGEISALETFGQFSLKRREQTIAPQAVKKIRFQKSESGSGSSKSIITIESGSVNDDAEINKCCVESKNILAIMDRTETQSHTLERLVEDLNSLFKAGLLPNDGSMERSVRLQLFDVLCELRCQRSVVHTLRQRLEEAVRVMIEPSVR